MSEIKELDFSGIYRGKVIDNYDPEIKGRCKLYVPGVYPTSMSSDGRNLPWAEPVMPLFGGSFQNIRPGDLNPEVGVSTIPHIGAELWTFFENSNHMYPKFFAACQAGSGWLSEHNNQHVIKTDNVRIRIDENPSLSGSTCKFDSYNNEVGNEIPFSKERSFKQKPTRVDIQIKAENCVALNIQILGDVNMNIVGNVYERIQGDKHETHIGNLYKYHKGDAWINHDGATLKYTEGDVSNTRKGDRNEYVEGSTMEFVTVAREETVIGPKSLTVYGRDTEYCEEDRSISVGSLNVKSMLDISTVALGNINEQCTEKFVDASHDIQNRSMVGNIVNKAPAKGYYDDKGEDNKYVFRGGIINESDYVVNMTNGTIVNASIKGNIYEQIVPVKSDGSIMTDVVDMYDEIKNEIRIPVTYDYNGTGKIINYATSDITSYAGGNINETAAGNINETATINIAMVAGGDITENAAVNITEHAKDIISHATENITDEVDANGTIDHNEVS